MDEAVIAFFAVIAAVCFVVVVVCWFCLGLACIDWLGRRLRGPAVTHVWKSTMDNTGRHGEPPQPLKPCEQPKEQAEPCEAVAAMASIEALPTKASYVAAAMKEQAAKMKSVVSGAMQQQATPVTYFVELDKAAELIRQARIEGRREAYRAICNPPLN